MKPITKTKKQFADKVTTYLESPASDYDIIECTIKVPTKLQKVECDGSSIWTDTHNKIAMVTSIDLEFHIGNGADLVKDEYYLQIKAEHNLNWDIYTDKGFEHGVSQILTELLGFNVSVYFTEQSMQANKIASLENSCKDKNSWKLANYIMNKGELA